MPPCPACGGDLRAWRRVADHEPGSAATHLLLRCSACGSAVTAGPAAPRDAHESGAYRPGPPRGAAAAAPLLHAFDRRRLGLLGPPDGKLVDVGAGRGRFVATARAAGWDARGIEPSARTDAPHVERVAVEDAEVAPGSLAAVSVWHVLEHLEDPRAALERVRGWLRPGGIVIVGVPNLDSLQARIGGARWYHLDLPRHRTHFTARGLHALLTATGFEVARTEHLLLEHNPFGMWQSLVNRATPTRSWLYHALKRNAPARAGDVAVTLAALPLAPLAAAAEAAAGLAGRGGTVAVVARSYHR